MRRLRDTIVTPRWLALISHLGVVLFGSTLVGFAFQAASESFTLGGGIALVVNAMLIGWSLNSVFFTLGLPAAFKGLAEANRAVMRDQLEADIEKAWEAFRARHPGADVEIDPARPPSRMN